MATLPIDVESTLTDRYQTTIPETVRRALHLGKRDKIRFSINENGEVLVSKIEAEGSDPALGTFLNFLAHDITDNPHRLESLNSSLVKRIKKLVGDVEVDLDSPLSDKDE